MAEEREPTYEEARDELMQVVAKLESGGVSLADSTTSATTTVMLSGPPERSANCTRRSAASSIVRSGSVSVVMLCSKF